MDQARENEGESLDWVEMLDNRLAIGEAVAPVHHGCSVKEVMEGVFSLVVGVPDDGDEVAELVEGHFLLLQERAGLEHLPDEGRFLVGQVEVHDVEIRIVDAYQNIYARKYFSSIRWKCIRPTWACRLRVF